VVLKNPGQTAGTPRVSDQNPRRLNLLPARTMRPDRFPHPAAKPLRPIDKAFLIATPMRKADWTKLFDAGWGKRGPANAFAGLLRVVDGNGHAIFLRNRC
jgi:hypothetical protein